MLGQLGRRLEGSAGPALMVGGLLWVLTYVVEIAIGVTLGEDAYRRAEPTGSILEWLWPACFVGAAGLIGVGLLGVASRIQGRGKVLGLLGALMASVAVAAAAVGVVTLSGVLGRPHMSDSIGFAGVIGVMAGSALVGSASLRAAVLPRPARFTLALLPLAFVPAIIATIPLAEVAPEYVVADLPFPVVGLVLAYVGRAIQRDTSRTRTGLPTHALA